MIEELLDAAWVLIAGIARNFLQVLAYPLDPRERMYVFYLATSLVMAAFAYTSVKRRARASGATESLAAFLFPRSVWGTRSAWLDVRYFFFHQIFRVFLYGAFVIAVAEWTLESAARWTGSPPSGSSGSSAGWAVKLGFAFASAAVIDFVAFAIHYCQHRIPLLWEFHRVHHSARVLHPLSNYREHPVDNIAYAIGYGACTGAMAAITPAFFGDRVAEPLILGVGLFVFAFNSLGYHLRHSHIWMRWPGPLVYLFGSPAHHQVHHSYHPEHVDKNFAFIFPIWDVLFGTFTVPASNADLKFGLCDDQPEEFTSCLGLYWVPFRNAIRSRASRRDAARR